MAGSSQQVLSKSENGNGNHSKENETGISEEEGALYDRQIRLWGIEAQKRLRGANALLVGLSGLGSEVTKNLVLAGVNSLTVLDHQKTTEYDSLSNLFTENALGVSRAKAGQSNIKALNPMVTVNALDWDIRELLEEKHESRLRTLMKDVNVVCITSHGKETLIKLNSFCRSLDQGIKFYATSSWGFYGFSFTDLGKGHQYVAEEIIQSSDTVNLEGKGDGAEPVAKKAKFEEPEKQIVEKTLDFASLESALAVKAGKAGVGLTKRTNPVLILTHIMFAFHSKNNRYPEPKHRKQDIEGLKQLQKQVIESLGLDDSFVTKLNSFVWWEKVFGEMSPIASIIGGVVGQDIIRAVSAKDTPIKNFFLFNGIECNGFTENVGK